MKLEKLTEYLAQQGIELSAASVLPSFFDPEGELKNLKSPNWTTLAKQTNAPISLEGTSTESMSLASMAAVHYLGLQSESTESVLDACSAPGMKALYLATLFPKVNLTANDISFDRLQRLERLFAKHAKHAAVTKYDAQFLHTSWPAESFDRVLLDAPCSGEGLIFAGNTKQLEAWSPAKVRRLQQLQVRMLKSAWRVLKPGGTLVYSTCTLNLNENERVLQKALKFTPEVITAPISLESIPELRSNQAWRIMPSSNSIGFFIAVCTKQHAADY